MILVALPTMFIQLKPRRLRGPLSRAGFSLGPAQKSRPLDRIAANGSWGLKVFWSDLGCALIWGGLPLVERRGLLRCGRVSGALLSSCLFVCLSFWLPGCVIVGAHPVGLLRRVEWSYFNSWARIDKKPCTLMHACFVCPAPSAICC